MMEVGGIYPHAPRNISPAGDAVCLGGVCDAASASVYATALVLLNNSSALLHSTGQGLLWLSVWM